MSNLIPHPIVLVDFYWTRDKDPRVPLGHASLLAELRRAGVPTTPIVYPVNRELPDTDQIVRRLLDEIQRLGPNTDLAIGVYVWSEDVVTALLKNIRNRGYRGRIILGGPQISWAEPGVDRLYPEADVFVRGCGEEALVHLAYGRPASEFQGIHLKGDFDLADRATIDLGKIASPWLQGVIPLNERHFVRWETQRGCPYRCTFCQHRQPGERRKWEGSDPERVLDEVRAFCESDVDQIAVLDPIFNIGGNSLPVLRALIEFGYQGELSLQCRLEMLNEEFLELASKLDVVLEFGIQTVHKNESKACGRANTIQKMDAWLQRVRELKIKHEVSLIFGLPEQTLESFGQSIAWCLDRRVPIIKAFPLMLLRGTQMERDRARWAMIDGGGSMPLAIESNTYSQSDWRAMAQLSDALSQTEGNHPTKFKDLQGLASNLQPNLLRWAPE